MSEITGNRNVFVLGFGLAALLVGIATFITNSNDTTVNPTSVETVKEIQAVNTVEDDEVEEIIVIGDPTAEIEENTNEE